MDIIPPQGATEGKRLRTEGARDRGGRAGEERGWEESPGRGF